MNPLLIIGWLFLLASWFPKPFIKDEQIRRGINLAFAGIAAGVFISGILLLLMK